MLYMWFCCLFLSNLRPPDSTRTDPLFPSTTRFRSEISVGCPIEQVDAEGVAAKGERIAAATVIWCAGVAANPAGRWLNAETARNGAVKVEADLSVPGLPGVYVIGDAARVAGPDGEPLDRKRVVEGTSGYVRVDLGGVRIIIQKK